MTKNIIIAIMALALTAAAAGIAIVGAQTSSTTFEFRIWERGGDHYLSARAVGGSWRDFGTQLVVLDQRSAGGWRYGDIAHAVPLARESTAAGDARYDAGYQRGMSDAQRRIDAVITERDRAYAERAAEYQRGYRAGAASAPRATCPAPSPRTSGPSESQWAIYAECMDRKPLGVFCSTALTCSAPRAWWECINAKRIGDFCSTRC